MIKKLCYWIFLVLEVSLFSSEGLYLTFPEDAATSMAVHWIDKKKDSKKETLLYRKKGSDSSWKTVEPSRSSLDDYLLYRAVLLALEDDTDYEFCFDKEEIFLFRTLPKDLSRPVRVAIGGDVYEDTDPYIKMNKVVASYSPDFAIVGGDIAYANQGKAMPRWITFFKEWQKTMRTKEGRMIPLVATVGNHDIVKKASYFTEFFPYLEKGSYGKIDVAKRASFFLLDTGHIEPIDGEQAAWLSHALPKACEYRFAVYHIAAYPSFYSMNREVPKKIRAQWCPSFEKNSVVASFENHNHAFKKTYPIKDGKINPEGVIYLGDGCWSVKPRKPLKKAWYLEEKEGTNNFFLLTLQPNQEKVEIEIQAIDINGRVIDKVQRP
jgi:hypothetical protein